jgi:hypothetical protein
MIGLPHNSYSRFKKAIKKANDLEQSDAFVYFKANGAPQKIHLGFPSLVEVIQDCLNQIVH